MRSGRDYQTQAIVQSITNGYKEFLFMYHEVALREVWNQFALKLSAKIQSNPIKKR